MRAVHRRRYGVEHLEVVDAPAPAIGTDQVLVRVGAAGVGLVDWHLTTGRPYAARLAFGLRRPRRPGVGVDVAGTVEAVGSDVTRFAVGDAVVGTGAGSFAELVAADEDRLVHRPPTLGVEEAAALPVAGCAALTAIDAVELDAGERVLVTGAGGGVGHLAVRLAVARGAEVTALTSTGKLDLVGGLGAVRVLDRTADDLAGTGPYDVVLDTGGGRPVRELRSLMTPRGRLAMIGDETGGSWIGVGRGARAALRSAFVRQRLLMIVSSEKREVLEPLVDLAASGAAPVVTRTVGLDDVANVLHDLEGGRVAGKVVVVP